jgi:hypothetical protein
MPWTERQNDSRIPVDYRIGGRPVSTRIPSYRLQKPTGQAVVTLSGKDVYLGKFGGGPG